MPDRIATNVSYAGATTAVVGGLSFNELIALTGVIVALATFIYNVCYKERLIRIAKEKGDIQIKD